MKNLITQPDKSSLDPSIKTFKDPVQLSIGKHENHNSINLIKNMMRNFDNPNFSFKYINFGQTLREIQKPNPKKLHRLKT